MKNNVRHIDFGKVSAAQRPADAESPFSEKDYTHEVIEFLRSVHGGIRCDGQGDYYYGKVSTISLHFLLNSALPAKEVLWAWYDYFDRERSESIYQTLPPLQDEAFLRILEGCAFRWNPEAVRSSGLVFLSGHRKEVYLALEDSLTRRLDRHRALGDDELRDFLRPRNTWSEAHLRRQARLLKTRPLERQERQAIYERFASDYLRATARQLMDEAASEPFWKKPPPELEALGARFKAQVGLWREAAIRLGVYVSREDYQARGWRGEGFAHRTGRRSAGARGRPRVRPAGMTLAEHFSVLGLEPTATLEEVKAAYREKVKAHHPDQGGTVPEFIRLQEAYEFLVTQVF